MYASVHAVQVILIHGKGLGLAVRNPFFDKNN
jgi:hypothetical protein